MAFDQPIRNRLARFVGEARSLLTEEFTRQLQHEYGLDPARGEVAELAKLTQLDDARRETARILRETLAHYLAGQAAPTAKARQEALDRIVREQAFTVLNRLCALRMAEARGIVIESIAKGYQSRGFQLYARLAGTALGETGEAYRAYLFSLFDEFAVDLAVLFDRFSPQGRLFPRASTLLQLLAAINHADLEPLWAEDETIGWIYQYFNSKEERKAMRDASQAPRNSRELAVRNQFFTPRYVVEFLTDNTLGRIWYEMTQGRTGLVDSCRYLVRRPTEVFLRDPAKPLATPPRSEWTQQAARGDFSALPAEPELADLSDFSLIIDGYELSERHGYGDCIDWADRQLAHYRATGEWPTSSLELWLILFRQQRYHGRATLEPDQAFYDEWRSAYYAFRHSLQQNDLSQEELLRQPVYIPFRQIKDPRTILMLDPACGSMHFGLYSFDLYERIYEEAWELEGELGERAFQRPAAMAPLRERYPDKASFLREVPRLIIEHNIHGIDIDPRAVQIAELSLWLRAQKSWQDQGLKPHERPTIRKSNIVCAEPMPGDQALLEEFLQGLRDDRLEALIRRVLNVPENQRVRATPTMADALCQLVRTVWEEMKLAGEAGSLLKIEESLTDAIAKGRAEWEEKMPLFRVETFRMTEERSQVNYVKVIPGEGADFWMKSEALVFAALKEYAEQAEDNGGYQRRLFAGDAVRGFAFIDLCRKRYDAVLMNPPFGETSTRALDYLEAHYIHWNANLLCAFLQRGWDWSRSKGCVGLIYDRTAIVKSTYEDFRRHFLVTDDRLFAMADLGWDVLDANVEVTTSVMHHAQTPGLFTDLRTINSVQKGEVLIDRIVTLLTGDPSKEFISQTGSSFAHLPNAVVGYDFPEFLQAAFSQKSSLENVGFKAYQGHALKSDKHFRLWWEINVKSHKGVIHRLFNGAGYSPYHTALLDCMIAPCSLETLPKDSATVLRNTHLHGIPGICFGKRGEFFCVHALPADHVFTVEGQAIPLISINRAYELMGFLNTPIVRFSLNKYCGQHKYSGYVNLLPYTSFNAVSEVKEMVRNTVVHGAEARRFDEIQSLFFPSMIGKNLLDYASHICDVVRTAHLMALRCEEFCHEQSLVAFNVHPQEQNLIEKFWRRQPALESPIEDTTINDDFSWFSAHTWISVPVGCAFGRWDIRFATGEKLAPPLPDPFAPLPLCPPGMLQTDQGLPVTPTHVPIDYPLKISWSGIMVGDIGHPEDIDLRVREVLRTIWPDRFEAIEQEACEILEVASLRAYFADPNGFFDDHLKRYSKSRRAAPIYWPLSTPSGSYTLWLYYHQLTDQTLYSCVNDFVDPKLKQVNEDVDTLRRRANRSRQEEKDLEQLSELALELAAFRDELLRIARFWQPNLNDGVQITAAPLWRLFQHRGWQKRLKETWAALEAGDYDWAHLAYSLWSDRVRTKCKTDKSLAIAHDLEHLYVEPVKPVKAKKGGGKKQVVDDDEQGELL